MAKKHILLKIELTGEVARRGQQATEPVEDKLTMLIEVMRTIAKDFGVTIDYPAMIYLDDIEEPPHGDQPVPNSDR